MASKLLYRYVGIDVDGVNVHYYEEGFGTPVIFLQNHNIVMHHLPESAEISLISTMGQIVAHKGAVRSSAYFENLPLGKYIAVIRNGNVRFSKIVQVK